MISKYLLLFISCIALGLTSCLKGHSSNMNYPVDGNWQQTSLRIYGDSMGKTIYDTTYTKPFTANDYIRFYDSDSCAMGSDHYYYPNIENYPKTPQAITPTVGKWIFTATGGSKYVLTQPNALVNPGGFDIADTVEVINASTLRLHVVFYSHAPGFSEITDSYYHK